MIQKQLVQTVTYQIEDTLYPVPQNGHGIRTSAFGSRSFVKLIRVQGLPFSFMFGASIGKLLSRQGRADLMLLDLTQGTHETCFAAGYQ